MAKSKLRSSDIKTAKSSANLRGIIKATRRAIRAAVRQRSGAPQTKAKAGLQTRSSSEREAPSPAKETKRATKSRQVPIFDTDLDPWEQPHFVYITEALKHNKHYLCDHEGPCVSSSDCACAKNKTCCKPGCKCGIECARQFPGCDCEDKCSSTDCPCLAHFRECTELCRHKILCSSCKQPTKCQNHSTRFRRKIPKQKVGPSQIPGAGRGLFAAEDIAEDRFLGEYIGEIVEDKGEEEVWNYKHFKIDKSRSIDPQHHLDRVKAHPYYVNHADSEDEGVNARFWHYDCAEERKIMLYADRDIKAGEEILASYGPDFADKFKQAIEAVRLQANKEARKTKKAKAIQERDGMKATKGAIAAKVTKGTKTTQKIKSEKRAVAKGPKE